ncbi:MAG: iron-sulfur cluster-binding protein [Gemmatimonadota bacterium]|nr:MAG: iron-sulfur cluster-binding protein [Gemmatimonadota bacterium]
MTVDVGAAYPTRVRQALADDALRAALDRATEHLRGRRAQALAGVDATRLRDEAHAVRRYAIEHLPDLLEQLEGNLIANGCQVHWARDAAEALGVVLEIAHQNHVKDVVKSKSMVTEEIGLNDALQRSGIDVVETDLGEFIIQLAGEPPSHIITPVIHKRLEDISEIFQTKLDTPPTDQPAELCDTARRALRSEFLIADMGISGCNFAIAETGTICIVTNEGNGRMVTSLPRVYVAIAGIEKVVRSVEDAVLLWQAASRNATGQDVSVYFSMSSGPRRRGDSDGPDEMHVILIDNGRSRILERRYGDATLCIRCGACINICPVYREIGGHAYGRTPYSGPIGAVITPLLEYDIRPARDLPFASSLCGACRDVCPVKIDLPRLLLDLRSDIVERRAAPIAERVGMRVYSTALRRPAPYRALARLARRLGRLAALLPPLKRWARTREPPRFAAKSFATLWRERGRRPGEGAAE